jgi:aminodeoxyfutalosine deaminase
MTSPNKEIKILAPEYLYLDRRFGHHLAVAFSDVIEAIDTPETLRRRYPEATFMPLDEATVLYPGFINSHVHLEFSSNRMSLDYGAFVPWLSSVIHRRDTLMAASTTGRMKQACREMMQSGVTTIGAISSSGADLETCVATPQRVVYFNELIGSRAEMVSQACANLVARYEASMNYGDRRVIPAIAIHSPYAVHPEALSQTLEYAKDQKAQLCAHLLESPEERLWLDQGTGPMREFFETFLNQSQPLQSIETFLGAFDGLPTHFVHCTQATQKELAHLATQGHTIAHCPRSNRLLGNGRLAIESLAEHNLYYTVATDGLSSNYSLSLLDELRAALMMHANYPLQALASDLIDTVTSTAADALKLNCGSIETGKSADFAIIQLPEKPLVRSLREAIRTCRVFSRLAF